MSKTLSLLALFAGLSLGAPVLTIIPSIGPSGNSTTYNTYNQNALGALSNSVTSFGLGPSGYNRLTGAFNPAHVVDTFPFFNSWLGIASPASPFDTKYGNNLYFGVRVEGFGAGGATSLALNDLVSTDNFYTGGTPNSIFFNTAGDSYDGLFILGVPSGPDGAPGGGDDIFLQSGEDHNIAVNALFYRGYSISFPVSAGSGTNQEQLDSYIASVLAVTGALPPQSVAASIKYGHTGFASSEISISATNSVPEPSTYALLGFGLAAPRQPPSPSPVTGLVPAASSPLYGRRHCGGFPLSSGSPPRWRRSSHEESNGHPVRPCPPVLRSARSDAHPLPRPRHRLHQRSSLRRQCPLRPPE